MLQIRNDKRCWWPGGGKQRRGQQACKVFYPAAAGAPILHSAVIVQLEKKFIHVHACTRMCF